MIFGGGTFFVFYEMTHYYDNANEFEGVEPIDYVMPYDVKRLIKHNRHTFMKRFYFYSPSERKFYRYFDDEQRAVVMKGKVKNERTQSIRYRFIPDISYSVGDRIIDDILLSRFFMKRVEGMKIIDL